MDYTHAITERLWQDHTKPIRSLYEAYTKPIPSLQTANTQPTDIHIRKFKHKNTSTSPLQNINKPAQLKHESNTFSRSAAAVMRGMSLLPVFGAMAHRSLATPTHCQCQPNKTFSTFYGEAFDPRLVCIYLCQSETSSNIYWPLIPTTRITMFKNSNTRTPPPHHYQTSTNQLQS